MNQRKIEILLLFFTISLIVSVVIIGVVTFTNLRKIERHSEKIYQPNKIILTLKQLVSELRNSESSVRSYNLYRSEDYLMSYQSSVQQIDGYFESLYNTAGKSPADKKLLDSVHVLVDRKFQLLNEQMWIRDNLKVVNELNVINRKLDAVVTKDTTSVKQPEQKKKKGFFSRLFKKKDKDTGFVAVAVEPKLMLNQKQLTAVKKEVLKVKDKQSAWLEEMNERELGLIAKDKVIMEKLQNIVGDLEKTQNDRLKQIAQENIKETTRTNLLLRVFGVLFFVILTLSGILSVYYFYNGRKYQKRLNDAANEAKRLAETRQNFLSNMSHEMRTPLNSIIGFTEQLLQSSLEKQQREQVTIVNSSSQHLLRLVNNLLDKARIDAGKISPEEIEFAPGVILADCVKLVSVNAAGKKLELSCSSSFADDMLVMGDPVLLKQVVLNILGNAVKFTDKGFVRLNASLEDAGEKKQLKISVTDSGVGIPKEKVSSVFGEFEQADNSISRKFGGTGLGLWITKKIIEAQGGSIDLQSEPGNGTVVSFNVLYRVCDERSAEPQFAASPDLAGERLTGKRILVVDDEVFNRKLVSAVLKKYKVVLTEAASGADALNMLEATDIVLADIHMPEMDGAQLTQLIRSNPAHNKIPVIALTADLTGEKRRKYEEAGIDDFVSKPFKETELLEVILKNIDNGKV